MLLSINWLREFVPYEGTVEALSDRLTMYGLEIEEVIYPFAGLKGVLVGHVLECDKHPEADKLSVCSVDVGQDEPLGIVCGAPNVAKGQKVAVAPVGTKLPNGIKLKKAKIRGIASQGMICAEDELGLSEDHEGIMVLDENLKPGTELCEALNLDEVVLDVGVTPNRADCLSVLGLAREVAMAFDLPLTMPKVTLEEFGDAATDMVQVEIDQPELCSVYQGRVIEGVNVKRAPDWMRYRLHAVGQRSISNIVDITNYVMFELGQPLHAFDMDLLEGGKVRVAPADEGMKFTTLDNQERTLKDSDLLIWDGKKPVALAGVMGGANSEMHEQSTRVFLESAVFKEASVRKTARRMSLPSEASYRFERGVDQVGSLFALNRASALMAEYGGGALRPGVCVAEPRPWKDRDISFRPERARALLGLDETKLGNDFCRRVIKGMGCGIDEKDATVWRIAGPSNRLDLEREVDIIEELGRVYGLDRIEPTLPLVAKVLGNTQTELNEYGFCTRLKQWAKGVGLNEAINYSFVGQKDLDLLGLPQEGRIPVKNPLTDEQDVLRTVLAPGLLQNVRHNLAQGNDHVRLFELAHVFEQDESSDTTAREPIRLGVMLYGNRWGGTWPHNSAEDADYLDLKGVVEHLLDFLHLPRATYVLTEESSWLTPCVDVRVGDISIGYMGRVEPTIADAHHARKDIWTADLSVDALRELTAGKKISFTDLPKFPPSRRDMTVIAPTTLPMGDILGHFQKQKSSLLENVALVDVFVPEKEESERNLTYRFTFRHAKRTLKDKDVDKEMKKMSNSLTKELPVRL